MASDEGHIYPLLHSDTQTDAFFHVMFPGKQKTGNLAGTETLKGLLGNRIQAENGLIYS